MYECVCSAGADRRNLKVNKNSFVHLFTVKFKRCQEIYKGLGYIMDNKKFVLGPHSIELLSSSPLEISQ